MTERTSVRVEPDTAAAAAACCDSVLLQTCCEAERKPTCCGPQPVPGACGCGGHGREGPGGTR
jgi:hypothetical protein